MHMQTRTTPLKIYRNTTLLYRHRFLRAMAEHRADHEGWIVDVDEDLFLASFKGEPVWSRPAIQRSGKGRI